LDLKKKRRKPQNGGFLADLKRPPENTLHDTNSSHLLGCAVSFRESIKKKRDVSTNTAVKDYLVASTHLKNSSQIGSFPQGVTKKMFETTTQI